MLDRWTGTEAELATHLGRSRAAVHKMMWRRRESPAYQAMQQRQHEPEILQRKADKALLYRRTHRAEINAAARSKAAQERATATRSGLYAWWEDALVAQVDLTVREVAGRLGRTQSSVRQRRARLRQRTYRPVQP